MVQNGDNETRGFAVACLLCICKDKSAHPAILEAGGAELLQALSFGPATWLRTQVCGCSPSSASACPTPRAPSPPTCPSSSTRRRRPRRATPRPEEYAPPETTRSKAAGEGEATGAATGRGPMPGSITSRYLSGNARMKFHFFSFQIYGTTGYMGHS